MAQQPTLFTAVTQLTATAAVLYTCPVNSVAQIIRAVAYNSDTVARVVTIHRVPNGSTPLASNIIVASYAGRIPAGQSLVFAGLAGMVLNPGDTIQVLADSATVVNFTMSGYLSTGS